MTSRSVPRPRGLALFVVCFTALVACGNDTTSTSSGQDGASEADHTAHIEWWVTVQSGAGAMLEGNDVEGHDSVDFAWGTPADPADADRVVEIEANDDFTFQPDQVDVAVGETVTFRVSNVGELPHDFTLGDAATQDEHDTEMQAMDMQAMTEGHGHDEANAMTMNPGETKEMTWTFDKAGTVIMGCHIPGHYAAGMHGDITVASG